MKSLFNHGGSNKDLYRIQASTQKSYWRIKILAVLYASGIDTVHLPAQQSRSYKDQKNFQTAADQ